MSNPVAAPHALLPMPSPWALAARLPALDVTGAEKLAAALADVRTALAEPAPAAAARLRRTAARLPAAGALAELPADTGTPLSREEVLDYDRRFAVARHAAPIATVLIQGLVLTLWRFMQMCTAGSALHAPSVAQQRRGFECHLALLARCCGLTLPAPHDLPQEASAEKAATAPESAWSLWLGFHWTFFIDTQGLVLSLLRLDDALAAAGGARLADAQLELDTATALLTASGAAMVLAAPFNAQVYEHQIRPAMMPPHVASEGFSGLMAWDHARLVRLWQQLRPRFAALPAALQPAHENFVRAYREMMIAHRGVCARFAGEAGSSLRSRTESPAVHTLDRIGQMRLQLIAPQDTAPPARRATAPAAPQASCALHSAKAEER